jgi:hypothetical protein
MENPLLASFRAYAVRRGIEDYLNDDAGCEGLCRPVARMNRATR